MAIHLAAADGEEGLIKNHHVHVSSELTGGKVLLVHCKSKDDDLGIHNLTAGSEFTWKFKLDVWLRTTLFWCYLAPDDSHHAAFDAFDEEHYKAYEFQYHTYWIGKDDGVYVKLVDKKTDQLTYQWVDGRPGPNLLVPKWIV
ncbi:unnamed protein product [Linum tenue]|uniref:S-protein homolog n=1 Tax=Linum tenue TaxID=586396 RepID=A0AAV0JTX3_9ROSI|nr:unnamed protein product [Linum tenue]